MLKPHFAPLAEVTGDSILDALLSKPMHSASSLTADIREALQDKVDSLESDNRRLRERIKSLTNVIEALTPEVDELIDVCAICYVIGCNCTPRQTIRVRQAKSSRW